MNGNVVITISNIVNFQNVMTTVILFLKLTTLKFE